MNMIEYAIGAVAGAVGGAAVGSMLSGAKKSELERYQKQKKQRIYNNPYSFIKNINKKIIAINKIIGIAIIVITIVFMVDET